jgi:hypothetical protein
MYACYVRSYGWTDVHHTVASVAGRILFGTNLFPSHIVLYLIVICVPSLADNFYAPWRYITHSSADLHTVRSSH